MHGIKRRKNVSPELTTNVLSQVFFCWLVRLLNLGKKKKLVFDDLYTCNDDDLSKPVADQLEKMWEAEIALALKSKRRPSLLKAIRKTYFTSYISYGLVVFLQCVIIKMIQPLVMYRLLTHFMNPTNTGIGFGIARATIFLVIAFVYLFLYQHAMLGSHRIGIRVKTACSSLIYRKLLKLSLYTIARSKLKLELNLLLTKDIHKLEKASMFLHYLWVTPIQTCIVLYFMYCLGGYFSTISCGTVFLFVVLSSGPLITFNKKYDNELKSLTSEQRKQMKDIVKNISTVKMFGCEDMINELVLAIRAWLVRLLNLGKKKKLVFDDLYTCNDDDLSKPVADQLEKMWEAEIALALKSKRRPSLLKAIRKTYFTSYISYGLVVFLQCVIIKMIQPLVMYRLLTHFMNPTNTGIGFGIARATIFLVIAFVYLFLYQHAMLGSHRIGIRVKTACSSLIYRKLLKLSLYTIARSKLKLELNLLLTKDIHKLEKASMFLHYLWVTPIQTCIVLYFMYCLGGYFSTIGCGTVFLFVVLSSGPLITFNEKYDNELKSLTSEQRKQMKDIVKNISTVKMFGCEDMINELVLAIRAKQRKVNQKRSYAFGVTSGIVYFSARLGIFATVMSYILADSLFTPQLMYTIIQFLNLIEVQMAVLLPMSIKCHAELRGVVRQIRKILLLPEMEMQVSEMDGRTGVIKMSNLTAGWTPEGRTHIMENVNLELKPGNVYAVTGPRQSGKSTFVLSILNEVPIMRGRIEVSGRISYASQEPWIFNSSIKHNIVLERRFQKNKYAFILKVCGINVDLQHTRYGDQSIVNEHISLDNSQQARLNMARAAYGSAEIYIFDECFESMKVSIAQKLYKGCIQRYLRPNKTVILVTNQIDILKMVDYVIVIKKSVVTMSTYNNIPKERLAKYRWLRTALDVNRTTNIELQAINKRLISEVGVDVKKYVNIRTLFKYTRNHSNKTIKSILYFLLFLVQLSINGGDFTLMLWASRSENCLVKASKGNYTEDVIIFEYSVNRVLRESMNLSHIAQSCRSSSSGTLSYFTIYTILAVSTFVFVTYAIYLYCHIRHKVNNSFHGSAFEIVLKADMEYYYQNAISTVVQGLTQDILVVESSLPDKLWDIMIIMSTCIGMVITMCVFVPIAIPLVFIIGFSLYKLHTFFTASTNDISKIVSDTYSDLFNHILQSMTSLVSIRANKIQQMANTEFHNLVDDNTSATAIIMIIWKMYSLYIDIFFTIFLGFMIYQFFFMPDVIPYIVSSVVGLVITDCYYFIGFVQYGLKQMNKVSLDLYSVQNIIDLKKIPQEPRIDETEKHYPDTWPSTGSVYFYDLTVDSHLLEDKLYHFNLMIENGQKVAIFGEPGSGQYCIVYALFRLCQYEGLIEIDNTDITEVDLLDVRRNISILPSEPIVFSTTLRNNLNYHRLSTTETMQKYINMVGMEERLELDRELEVKEFSVEDKQLINLMRILVKMNRIVVWEESAMKLDKEVENEIDRIMSRECRSATIIRMTNQLPKIVSYDFCVFLEKGRVVKQGVPHKLISDKDPYVMKYLGFLSPEELAQLHLSLPKPGASPPPPPREFDDIDTESLD